MEVGGFAARERGCQIPVLGAKIAGQSTRKGWNLVDDGAEGGIVVAGVLSLS